MNYEPSAEGGQSLRSPVMIAAFEGWNDAGDAATAAVEQLALAWDSTPLAEVDPEDYYDFQVARPETRLVDGVTRRIEWPSTRVSQVRLPPESAAHDVLLVRGIEPNYRWRTFCQELVELADRFGVSQVICLGALLADVPHTRPVQVSGSAPDPTTAARFGLATSTYEGPTGITGVLTDACVQHGIPALSFWAAVPHYVAQGPHPKATVALLNRIEEVLDVAAPLGALPEQAEEWEAEVSDIAAQDDDITAYIATLEESTEDEVPLRPASGDALAAEFERYLRRRGRPGR